MPYDLRLHGVRVLKFIDHQEVDSGRRPASDTRSFSQQVTRMRQQVSEIEHAEFAFCAVESPADGLGQSGGSQAELRGQLAIARFLIETLEQLLRVRTYARQLVLDGFKDVFAFPGFFSASAGDAGVLNDLRQQRMGIVGLGDSRKQCEQRLPA